MGWYDEELGIKYKHGRYICNIDKYIKIEEGKYANEDYKYVRHYIDNMQSAIYKFGLWQEQIYADWNKWRDSSKQNTKELKEWFNKCFDNGDIIITKEDYKQKLFNNVF